MLIPEFEKQSGVLLCWPHAGTDWANQLDSVEQTYLEIVRLVSLSQPVVIICNDATLGRHVTDQLLAESIPETGFILLEIPCNDTWIRDYGPLCTTGKAGNTVHDFVFNGWGGKHPSDLDNKITGQLLASGVFGDTAFRQHSLVLEGGSIETDGQGTLLTTSRCLLAPNRNPGLDRQQLEAQIGETLGIERFLWLEHGRISGDDTDGHIDMLARFCMPDHILYTGRPAKSDPDYDELAKMEAQLADFTDKNGNQYRLTPLPCPSPVYSDTGRRLPASYANFLITNERILAPVYDVPEDDRAIEIISDCFQGHEVHSINCRSLIEQNGSLHCATMHIPEAVPIFKERHHEH